MWYEDDIDTYVEETRGVAYIISTSDTTNVPKNNPIGFVWTPTKLIELEDIKCD